MNRCISCDSLLRKNRIPRLVIQTQFRLFLRRSVFRGIALQKVCENADGNRTYSGSPYSSATHGARKRTGQLCLRGEPSFRAGTAVVMQTVEERYGVEKYLGADLYFQSTTALRSTSYRTRGFSPNKLAPSRQRSSWRRGLVLTA
jgi:hypothetical protein